MVGELGLSPLTLAALAERLGVRQPSLYKHIDGIDGLQRSLALRAKRELAQVLARAAVGRARDQAVAGVARAYRAWASEHPGRYALVQSAPVAGDEEDEVASATVVQVVLDILAGYRLHDDDAIDATRMLRSALHGFVTLEAGGGFGLALSVDRSFERLIGAITMALSQWDSVPSDEA
jgi:AcrR family transcriptional regulator